MPVLLFNLRGVPDDEARDVRELLEQHRIDSYETPAGRWGLSSPGIWLEDEDQFERAKALIDTYQRERALRARQEYRELKAAGRQETLLDRIRRNPLQVVLYLAIVLLVLYLSTKPFLDLGK